MRFSLFGLRVAVYWGPKPPRLEGRPRRKSKGEASDEFWDAFQLGGGGVVITTCQCGRRHFVTDETGDWARGELEELLERAREDPELFIPNDRDSSIGVIDGPEGILVWGCPCAGAERWERFLVSYRREIIEYYRAVHVKNVEAAAREERDLQGLEVPDGE